MKISSPHYWTVSLIAISLLFSGHNSIADDTCIFTVSEDDVPPSIILLLDSGAEMEQITWYTNVDGTPDDDTDTNDETNGFDGKYSGYDNSLNYGEIYAGALGCTIEPADVVAPDTTTDPGVCFGNENGYALVTHGSDVVLVGIDTDLNPKTYDTGFDDNGTATSEFTIGLSSNVFLPYVPSAVVDADGVKDNATIFRYSANYLNWIFYFADHGETAADADDAIDLRLGETNARSRFYYAKQAIFTAMKESENKALFSVYYFVNDAGSSSAQPLKLALTEPLAANPSDNIIDPNFLNNVNNMGTNSYSPLAEGLATVGGYFNSASAGLDTVDCAKLFIIVVTPGLSSKDFGSNLDGDLSAPANEPDSLSDDDGDGADAFGFDNTITIDGTPHIIPKNFEGSTYLDDTAYYLFDNDIGYPDGYQNVFTYTIGFMGNAVSNMFLINTSNNGNGNLNLYDSTDEEYGKYHFTAEDPDGLAAALIAAINDILTRTSAFAAPVVPVTRTTSGNRLYMSFFTPRAGNFWEGNVIKFGLDDDNHIVDKYGNLATWPNGALREDAVPFWATIDWAKDSSTADPAPNGVLYSARSIYSYMGSDTDIIAASNSFNDTIMTAALLGTPTHTVTEIVDYVRGGDPFDEDEDEVTAENRDLITGDVLHSEPLVYEFIHSTGSLELGSVDGSCADGDTLVGDKGGRATLDGAFGATPSYRDLITPFLFGEIVTCQTGDGSGEIVQAPYEVVIFFGSNDGMLHAVNDSDGTEAWAFIPPNQLSRLKDIVEGTGHSYYVDSSPKIYLYDNNGNNFLDTTDGDQVILVSGERKGSTSYFALDVTDPQSPSFLWRIADTNDPGFAPPDTVFDELGESWSEPTFGRVKTFADDTTGTPVLIIGGGYNENPVDVDVAGKAVLFINLITGFEEQKFNNTSTADMVYGIPSQVRALDVDSNGFRDKVYVGDLGGQMWRMGRFTDASNNPLTFPASDEDINNWTAQVVFETNDVDKKFFYPPSITLEVGYDLILSGTGDRENPCDQTTSDIVFAVKDTHTATTLTPADLVDVTDPAAPLPDLDGADNGWFITLTGGEKVLSEGTVFAGMYFFTTFVPNDNPCLPGGIARVYGLKYKTGAAALVDSSGSPVRSIDIGGGIPSKPVLVISEGDEKILISVGATNPDAGSDSQDAGIVSRDTGGGFNFFYRWWRELFN